MKVCFKCKRSKRLSEYYRHPQMGDGHLNKCKECTKKDVSVRISIKLKDPDWVARERARCREKMARTRKAGLEVIHPRKMREYRAAWERRNRHARKAQSEAARAQLKGILMKPANCENCGRSGRIEKHHPDYNQPLYVQWLCPKCHGRTRWK